MLSIIAALAIASSATAHARSAPISVAHPTPLDALARGVVLLHPMEAILKAADVAPAPVSGVFDLTVRAAGFDRGTLYLNSEADYRDQRNLTISIRPTALAALQKRFGSELVARFKGHRILVLGQARRVRIDFIEDGKPSGKYYYQTHVLVVGPDQVQFAD